MKRRAEDDRHSWGWAVIGFGIALVNECAPDPVAAQVLPSRVDDAAAHTIATVAMVVALCLCMAFGRREGDDAPERRFTVDLQPPEFVAWMSAVRTETEQMPALLRRLKHLNPGAAARIDALQGRFDALRFHVAATRAGGDRLVLQVPDGGDALLADVRALNAELAAGDRR